MSQNSTRGPSTDVDERDRREVTEALSRLGTDTVSLADLEAATSLDPATIELAMTAFERSSPTKAKRQQIDGGLGWRLTG